MDEDTSNFLETLLWMADDPDEKKRPFRSAAVWQFSDECIAAVSMFIKRFRDFLTANGFDMTRLEGMQRSFGGNCYFSLSGQGCGFWDDRDSETGDELHRMIKLYSVDDLRFHELEYRLMWWVRGTGRRIDIDYMIEFLSPRRAELFEVSDKQIHEQLKQAGNEILAALNCTVQPDTGNWFTKIRDEEKLSQAIIDWREIRDLKRP